MRGARRWAALTLVLLGCASGAPAARDAGRDAGAPPRADASARAPDAGSDRPRDAGRPPPGAPPDDDAGAAIDGGGAGAPSVAACDDGVANGEETARDCGGRACMPCALGARCVLDRDCAEGECTQQVCACSSDSDGDGTLDCDDACELDPARTQPGDCGCANAADVPAAGTACDDGECVLSSECDGQGNCGSAADCDAPDPACATMLQHAGHIYYVCPSALSWSAARSACQTNPHFDLIRVDNASEQTFLQTSITSLTDDVWLNATDMDTPDTWVWMDDDTVFWQGDSTGAAVGGLFNDWASGAPTSTGDCVRHVKLDAAWRNAACTETDFFVCEAAPP